MNQSGTGGRLCQGCTLYATGGGGLPENGIVSLMSEIEKNGSVGWTDVAEIPMTYWRLSVPYGSIAPHDEYTIKEMEGFGYTEGVNKERRLARRFRNWRTILKNLESWYYRTCGSQYIGSCISGQFPGMLAVDGDYCGRALEILQITPYLNGKECLPVTSWMNGEIRASLRMP
ncbi:MAG: DUF917 family protein [[Clostridium] scindens]